MTSEVISETNGAHNLGDTYAEFSRPKGDDRQHDQCADAFDGDDPPQRQAVVT